MEIKSVSGFGDYVRHRVFDELHWEYTIRQITKSFTKRTWRNGRTYHRDDYLQQK